MLLFFCYETEELWVNTKPCFLKMVCGNIPLMEVTDTTKMEFHICIPPPKKNRRIQKHHLPNPANRKGFYYKYD